MPIEPRLHQVQCITRAGLHRMAYAEWGDPENARVLVCVHGLTRVGRDFDALARALAPHYRVVCPDVVGRGRSDYLADPMLYDMVTYVCDMVTLLARLNADTVHWFGTSMGGLIGMGLASLPDSPIQRLILNDVGPVISAEALARIADYVGKPVSFSDMDEAERYIRDVSTSFGQHSDAEWRHLTEIVMKRDGARWILHYDPAIGAAFRAAGSAYAVGKDVTLWQIYDAIHCPTLSVRGEFSDMLSCETHKEMARRGPKAELVTLPGVGHAPTFMHPDQIAIAREFLLRENFHA